MKAPQEAMKAPQEVPSPAGRLEHIDGMRALATLWIVVGHFAELPVVQREALGRLLSRGHVAVGFYIVLSGFVTQWAYGRRQLLEEGRGAVGTFFARRFGRIFLSYYFSCLVGAFQRLILSQPFVPVDVLLSLLLLEAWVPARRIVAPGPGLNPAGWTISTLAFAWLCFPVVQFLFRRGMVGYSHRLILLSATCVAVTVGPVTALYRYRSAQGAAPGQIITMAEGLYFYQFPLLRFPEFVLGMCAAELAQCASWQQSRWLALAAAPAIALPVGLAASWPYAGSGRCDAEILFVPAFSACWACLLLATSLPHSTWIKQMFAHPALMHLGKASFAVYLLQWAWYYDIFALQQGWVPSAADGGSSNSTSNSTEAWAGGGWQTPSQGLNSAYTVAFLLVLWWSATVWTDLVELPFAKAMRSGFDMPKVATLVMRFGVGMLIAIALLVLPLLQPFFHDGSTPPPLASPVGGLTLSSRYLPDDNCSTWLDNGTSSSSLLPLLDQELGPWRFEDARMLRSSGRLALEGRWLETELFNGSMLGDWGGLVARVRVRGAAAIGLAVDGLCWHGPGHEVDCTTEVPFGFEAIALSVDRQVVGVANLDRTCDWSGDEGGLRSTDLHASKRVRRYPSHHVLHMIEAIDDPKAEHTIQMLKIRDAGHGGLALRGLFLPQGAELLEVSDVRPGMRGRLLAIGGSRSSGNRVLCQASADSETDVARLQSARNAFYTWPSLAAAQLQLQFTAAAIGAGSLFAGHPCEETAEWMFRTMRNWDYGGQWDPSASEMALPTRLVVIWLGKQTCNSDAGPEGIRGYVAQYANVVNRLLNQYRNASIVLWSDGAEYNGPRGLTVHEQVRNATCVARGGSECLRRVVVVDGEAYTGAPRMDSSDNYTSSGDNRTYTSCDGHHPNLYGMQAIAQRTLPLLARLIGTDPPGAPGLQ